MNNRIDLKHTVSKREKDMGELTFTKKKQVREGHRAPASKLVTKIVETVQNASPESTNKDCTILRQSQVTLKEKIKVLEAT